MLKNEHISSATLVLPLLFGLSRYKWRARRRLSIVREICRGVRVGACYEALD